MVKPSPSTSWRFRLKSSSSQSPSQVEAPSESLSAGAYREGEGIRPEGHTCTQLGQESCESGIAFCEWQDAQCTVAPVKSAGLVWLGFGRTVVSELERPDL